MYSNTNRIDVPYVIKISSTYFMHLCSKCQEKCPFYSKVRDVHTSFTKQYINSLHVICWIHGHIMIMLTFLACQRFLALNLR